MLQNDYNALKHKVKSNLEQMFQIHMKETIKLLDSVPKSDQNLRSSDSNIKQTTKMLVGASAKDKRYSQPPNIVNLMTLNFSKVDNNDMSNNNYTKQEIRHSNSSSSIVIVYPDSNNKNSHSKNSNQSVQSSRVRQQISKYEEILK